MACWSVGGSFDKTLNRRLKFIVAMCEIEFDNTATELASCLVAEAISTNLSMVVSCFIQ